MFGYVILHYQNIEITECCVNTLIKNTVDGPIIVVDNCSPNGSGKQLKKQYLYCERVNVIINSDNLGFAQGNNLGFGYIKNNYSVDYIVIMNNDIIIEKKNFEQIIEQFMEKHSVDVCGPDIVTLKGNHQNPLALIPHSSSYLARRVKQDKIKYSLLKTSLFWSLYKIYKKRYKIPIRKKQETAFRCILHGSCVIFGPRYIENEQIAFLPITYMYNEEAILYDYLIEKGYKTGYCSDITILHMEGISTTSSMQTEKKKVLFRFKNNIKSIEAQLKERLKYK